MDRVEEAETGIEILGVLVGAYLIYKLISGLPNFFNNLPSLVGLPTTGGVVTGTEPFVGGGKLTAQQALGIAHALGTPGGGYTLSPDGTQIWFYDSSYWDNTKGHYFDSSGADKGNLMQAEMVF